MYKLTYHKADDKMNEVVDQLQTLSLAFTIQRSDQPIFELRNGNESFNGFDQIISHLEQLKEELKQWYYCDC